MKKRHILPLLLLALASFVLAIDSPVTMLDSAAQEILRDLRANRAQIKRQPDKAKQIVKRIALPNMDVQSMSRAVLGRNVWRSATSEQKTQFIREFTELVVNTYAAAFRAYTDEDVRFYPVRGGYENKPFLQVRSQIIQNGGPPINVNYSVVVRGGRWKVYDFSIDGVSLVRSYRSQFASEISTGGMPKLLQTLVKHNRRQIS